MGKRGGASWRRRVARARARTGAGGCKDRARGRGRVVAPSRCVGAGTRTGVRTGRGSWVGTEVRGQRRGRVGASTASRSPCVRALHRRGVRARARVASPLHGVRVRPSCCRRVAACVRGWHWGAEPVHRTFSKKKEKKRLTKSFRCDPACIPRVAVALRARVFLASLTHWVRT